MHKTPLRGLILPSKSVVRRTDRARHDPISVCLFSNVFVYFITKTCLYNFDPLKPYFYIVQLGFTGYTLFFLVLLERIDCGNSLEPPRRGGSNEYPLSMF